MPFNLLLLPLLGGYIFVRKCFRTRYNALRSENYRLLFLAAEFGLYFLLLAAGFRLLSVSNLIPLITYIDHLWHKLVPFDFAGTAFLAFFFGITLWKPVNWLFRFNSEQEVDRAIRDKNDPLEILLKDAMRDSKAVLVTLDSGKVYVGHVITNFNPVYDVRSIKISPIVSGYRKPEDQTVVFNIDYTELLTSIYKRDPSVSERDRGDLGIVIPLDEIKSASIFSLPMYKRFFAHPANHPQLPPK
jgi:hypothetical protein